MEFEGVSSAIVAAVLISMGIGGDWARWTNVPNKTTSAQVATRFTDAAYKGSAPLHDNAGRTFERSKSSALMESASLSTGASASAGVPSVRFCSSATLWMLNSVDESRSSGVTFAGNFSLKAVPADNYWDTLTGEPAE
jgi:hypothetical protein